ncbi:Fic family protein [Candidatus Microgenomates bacterium]|nr:Fic family protein [Candidatus Microgenomates bacterium]
MEINYTYRKTPIIVKYLQQLEVLRKVIDLLPQLPHIEENLRRRSFLRSSLFSARIEGNKLKLEDIDHLNLNRQPDNLAKKEIFNILNSFRKIYAGSIGEKLSKKLILEFHRRVMDGISPEAGNFRTEPSAIFNQAGVAIYLPPMSQQIPQLLNDLISLASSTQESSPANAAVVHFAVEKIHPFIDGNGRVGRLIATFLLKKDGFDFRGLVSLEKYLDDHRQTYYDLLAIEKKDITPFVEFFLEALSTQAEIAVDNIKEYTTETPEDLLLPRRGEILAIIKDHGTVSFDFLKRRFVQVPTSTLHYDLKKLIEGNFIKKLGTTRGVCYCPKEK